MASLVLPGLMIQLVGRAVGLVLCLVTLTPTIRYLVASDYGLLVTVVAFARLVRDVRRLGRRYGDRSEGLRRLSLLGATFWAPPQHESRLCESSAFSRNGLRLRA
jgi:hypothetical protein